MPDRTQLSFWSSAFTLSRCSVVFGLLLFSVAVILRIFLALQPGLWADEIFSLAMATGHSLEHPADAANPDLGDFVEPGGAQPPAAFRKYMQHERSPAGPGRVMRAVLLSDTSPPLYYLALNYWTRVFGTGDAALRLFSTLWALLCLPLLWSLGRRVAGRETAWTACILFALSPPALYYSAEGRMYSLLWFLALVLALTSFTLSRRGPRPLLLLLWIAGAAAGLLTHYFFVFVFTACFLWLGLHPGSVSRKYLIAAVLLAGLLVLPWYLQIPQSLDTWRVTAGWLGYPLTWKQALTAPFILAYSFLSGYGIWGGSKWTAVGLAGLYALLILVTSRQGIRQLFSERLQLLWLIVITACVGPVVFDLVRSTNASLIARYALPGLPAGLLLAAVAIGRLHRKARIVFLVLVLAAWLPGIRGAFTGPSRGWEPFPEVGGSIAAWADPADLVIVHSTPSGVIGVARYVETDLSIASWIPQLKQRRVPDDIEALTADRSKVALVKTHYLGEPSPAEAWLRENARLDRVEKFHALTEILYFSLAAGISSSNTEFLFAIHRGESSL